MGSLLFILPVSANLFGVSSPLEEKDLPVAAPLGDSALPHTADILFKVIHLSHMRLYADEDVYRGLIRTDPTGHLLLANLGQPLQQHYEQWHPATRALTYDVVWLTTQDPRQSLVSVLALSEIGEDRQRLQTWVVTDKAGQCILLEHQKHTTLPAFEGNQGEADYERLAPSTYAFFQHGSIAPESLVVKWISQEWIEYPILSEQERVEEPPAVPAAGGSALGGSSPLEKKEVGKLMAQADLFKRYLLERLFISEAFKRIKNFNARKPALRVKISRDAFGKVFGGYSPFFKPDIESIDFWIVGNSHIISSLRIVNVNSDNNNFAHFFYKYGFYLFSFILFIIPYLMVREILLTLQPPQFSFLPLGSLNSLPDFFFAATAIFSLLFSVLTKSNGFLGGIHEDIIPIDNPQVNRIFFFVDAKNKNYASSPVTNRIYANAEVNFSIFPVRTNLIETHIPNIYEFVGFR